MKKFTKIMAICFLSFLFLTSINAQNTIPGLVPLSLGPVGLSATPFVPIQLLDVNGGNINLNTPANSFMINSQPVLQTLGPASISVGVGAGAVNAGANNTFLGNNAGAGHGAGFENTFIGAQACPAANNRIWCTFVGAFAGQNSGGGQDNTFLGARSGMANNVGQMNTFIGTWCGVSNLGGSGNTALGDEAGSLNTNGMNNVFLGFLAGTDGGGINGNTTGSGNVFAGFTAGFNNQTGNDNVIIGDNANIGTTAPTNLTNSIAIGANSVVMNNNHMILGDTNVWVGIGLSADPAGPQNSLEINARNNTTGAVINNKSGLRFRRLTSASPSTGAYVKFLTVNGSGDVVLGDGNGGGDVTACSTINPLYKNFVTKWSNIPTHEICKTIAFDDGNSIGVNTNVSNPAQPLFYTFQNNGTATFNLQSTLSASAYTYSNTQDFPLAVKTSTDHWGNLSGLAILSSAPNLWQDALHIWVDNQNTVFHTNIGNNTIFQDKIYKTAATWPTSLLALQPYTGTVVIQHDFGFNPPAATLGIPVTLGGDNCLFYVESSDNYTDGFPRATCIYANHIARNGGTAIRSEATGITPCPGCTNTAGAFLALNADVNYAVRCSTYYTAGGPVIPRYNTGGSYYAYDGTVQNAGVICDVNSPTFGGVSLNYGGWFRAQKGLNNYGVYATAPLGCTPICAPPPCITVGGCTSAAGYFVGEVYSSAGYWVASDTMLKDSLTMLSPLDTSVTNSINAYSYNYKNTSFPTMGLPSGKHYGFIAEEIGAKFPNLVSQFHQPAELDSSGQIIHDGVDFLAVNYQEVIALLWSGFRSTQQQLDSLKQAMAACCAMGSNRNSNPNTTTGSIELENLKSIQLDQNDPNPFIENTIIHWSIPTDFKEATILFFDNGGNQINKYKIEQKGNGELQVFGSKLSAGIYNYSLVVDSKLIDSKKMLKSR